MAKSLVDELHSFLHAKVKREEKEMTILTDGKQLSVRIPSKFVRAMQLNPGEDKMKFELLMPKPNEDMPAKLVAVIEKKVEL